MDKIFYKISPERSIDVEVERNLLRQWQQDNNIYHFYDSGIVELSGRSIEDEVRLAFESWRGEPYDAMYTMRDLASTIQVLNHGLKNGEQGSIRYLELYGMNAGKMRTMEKILNIMGYTEFKPDHSYAQRLTPMKSAEILTGHFDYAGLFRILM